MSILTLRKCQKEFEEILSSTSNLNTNRFLRLIALASLDVLIGFPLNIVVICLNAGAAQPWISWEETHYGKRHILLSKMIHISMGMLEFSNVGQILASMWRMNTASQSALEFNRWMFVLCGLVFFLFFGFADEAQKNYKLAINSIAKRVGLPGYTTNAGKINTVSSSFGCVFRFPSISYYHSCLHFKEHSLLGLIPNPRNKKEWARFTFPRK